MVSPELSTPRSCMSATHSGPPIVPSVRLRSHATHSSTEVKMPPSPTMSSVVTLIRKPSSVGA